MRATSTLQRVVRLNQADLPTLLRLIAEEAASLPPDFLQARGEPELLGYLDGSRGQAFGVFEGQALQAMALLRLPAKGDFAGSPAFPLVPTPDWPQGTAFLESTLVRRWARGHGLQRRLIKARAIAAEAAGRRWLCTGVHPENVVSWRNLMRSGLLLVGCRPEPAPARFGFLRPLNGASLPLRPGTVRRVHGDNLKDLQSALAVGLIGAALEPDGSLLFRASARAELSAVRAA